MKYNILTQLRIKFIIPFFAFISVLFSCTSKGPSVESTNVEHATLLIANAGTICNYNLDAKKISWEYTSKIDTAGNRNYFILDGQSIFMPFESGKFLNMDVNTGKIIWNQQILGNEDAVQFGSDDQKEEEERIQELMPIFMSKPLVDGQNILIASTGQPGSGNASLYNFERATGSIKWFSSLYTVYNFYAPVKCRDNYFVNSAVYLEMFSADNGTSTSYGMFEGDVEVVGEEEQHNPLSQFESPIYMDMQSDGEKMYMGDENGTIYCLQLNKDAVVSNPDVIDPNNTFILNPKIFNWTFKDSTFNFPKNGITFLENDVLYTEMNDGVASQSCFFALNTKDGSVKWKKHINGAVLNWTLYNEKIVGCTKNSIFYVDASGDNFIETKIANRPLSNIEWIDETQLIFISEMGIEIFDIKTKKATLSFEKTVVLNEHNNVQIKYIGN